jgi:hypothetical protein
LGTFGVLPPLTANHHGIAAPFIESKLLLLTSTSLINHRFLALVVICITALIIFMIIQKKSGFWVSSIFTLLWLSANPSWAGSMKSIPNQLQSLWPNMWIQLLTVLAVLIALNRDQLKISHQVSLGILVGSIPFFRIQGLITCIVLCVFIYLKFRKWLFPFCITVLLTILYWTSLIQVNGGLKKYLVNILINPFTVSDYAPWRSTESIFLNLGHKIKYFLVIALILLLCSIIITLVKNFTYNRKKSNSMKEFSILLLVLLTIFGLTYPNKYIWLNSIYDNFTILLIDSAVAVAFIYISYTSICCLKLKSLKLTNQQIELSFLSILVLVNLINQFPLSDRGHKWWACAPSVLLLAKFFHIKPKVTLNYFNKIDWKSSVHILAIVTITFSIVEARIFQQIDRIEITDYEYANFNGLQYPSKDSESVNNLLSSVRILTGLENRGVDIKYMCEDGLYHIRKEKYSKESLLSLNKNIDKFPYLVNGVVFYCNSGIYNIPILRDFNVYSIGNNKTDLFIAPKNDALTNSTLSYLLRPKS